MRHGAKRKLCRTERCTNQAHCRGMCARHEAVVMLKSTLNE
jgi:hypothetical protein